MSSQISSSKIKIPFARPPRPISRQDFKHPANVIGRKSHRQHRLQEISAKKWRKKKEPSRSFDKRTEKILAIPL